MEELGHPIGCSGAWIVVTLLHSLIQENKELDLATPCIAERRECPWCLQSFAKSGDISRK